MTKILKIHGYPILNNVWKRLLVKLPKEYRNLVVAVSLTNMSYGKGEYELTKGAVAPRGQIIIGTVFLRKYKNNAIMLASMLAHELGHHVLGHTHSYKRSPYQEQDADQFGLTLALNAKFNGTKYVKATHQYESWRKKKITKYHKQTHGTALERIVKLNKQLTYLGIKEFDEKTP